MSHQKHAVVAFVLIITFGASVGYAQTVWYVDDDAPSGGDGASWYTAYRYLQDALAVAESGDEIRVAGGIYTPDQDEARNVFPGDRTAAFHVIEGVIVRGGYAGIMAPDPDERDIETYVTFLSGDLNSDDGPGSEYQDENSYQVVVSEGAQDPPRLDGITVVGGGPDGRAAASGPGWHRYVPRIPCRKATEPDTGRIYAAHQDIRADTTTASRSTSVVLYVDENAAGPTYDGTSWCNAYLALQDALVAASASGGVVTEIRVADGVYKPDEGATYPDGSGDHEATFELINGLALRGGYAGCGAVDPDERDIEQFETLLSGDLDDDDGPEFTNRTDNSYTLVLAVDLDSTTVLDGLTIASGYAPGSSGGPSSYSGGILAYNAELVVIDCTLRDHWARFGGGAFNTGSTSGSTLMVNCRFIGNFDLQHGAFFTTWSHVATLINCSFFGNGGSSGGGMGHAGGATPTLINCFFSGNYATYDGGAIWNVNNAFATLINCTVSSNTASHYAGGVMNREGTWGPSNAETANTVLWGNTDSAGSGEFAQYYTDTGPYIVDYCCIQEWTGFMGGTGNIGDDPVFIDDDGSDDVFGTVDDDVHLALGSPAIDAGDNTAVPPSVTTDLEGNPRFEDDMTTPDTGNGTPPIVDMGVYEFRVTWVCGDGVVEGGEQCDEGGVDAPTCDEDCTFVECGDGHRNAPAGEDCDDGVDNSDVLPDACRTDCTSPGCGDGVTDTGEECDDGVDNSNVLPDACRTDCTSPQCGDGVTDTGEECDDGADNSNVLPDACRTDCTAPQCGDGVTDTGEECDDGPANSDVLPDACRTDCRAAHCGDGVIDWGEDCDGDADERCPGECRSDCSCLTPAIPAMGEWGVVILGLLLLTGAKLGFGRRRLTP